MGARYLEIVRRTRPRFGRLSSLGDFGTVPAATADVAAALSRPNVTLYCLEDKTREAVFTELPEAIDLTAAAFVFDAQQRHARHLIVVPYGTFIEAARQLPAVGRLVLQFTTGRGGSTLLSHALNECDSVVSLSEPDVLSQFAYLQAAYRGREGELRDLLDAAMRFVCAKASSKRAAVHAVKLRAEATQAVGVFRDSFPEARNLFVYRDVVGWVASFYRLLGVERWPEAMPVEVLCATPLMFNIEMRRLLQYLAPGTTHVSPIEALTLLWIGLMQTYLDAHAGGVAMLPIRYSDMTGDPRRVLQEIASYCDLPGSWPHRGLRAFERDSQEGTSFRRANPKQGNSLRFGGAQLGQIISIARRHPVLSEPDCVLPGPSVLQ